MCKGDKESGGALCDSKCLGKMRGLDGQIGEPEVIGCSGAGTFKEEVVVKVDLDKTGGEGGGTAGITELADGDKGGITEGGEKVGSAGRDRKMGEIQVDLVGGDHDGVVGEGDMESQSGGALIRVGGID
jgi:hypothetical protein